jgi:hypothetical protein
LNVNLDIGENMKTLSVLRIIGSTVLLLVPVVGLAQGSEKVDKANVCHLTGNGTYRLINISKNAMPAHLDHGDALPGSLVGDKFLADDCTLKETTRAASPALALGPLGWGGWSCPSGTTVVGGGYEPAEATVLVSEAAKPESASGLYPAYPHYTFSAGETGWVVQNSNTGQTLTIYAICVAN